MAVDLKGRSLLSLFDYSKEEIMAIIDRAKQEKENKKKDKRERRFEGYSLAMLYEKPSTRTRCAFETAFGEEGGHPVFLSPKDIQLGAKETLADTARVLGRMFDAIQFRGFKQQTVEDLSTYSSIPVFNGLTDNYHPTQALADFLTVQENFGALEDIKGVYIGDGRNNVAHSLLIAAAKIGMELSIISPEDLFPDKEVLEKARECASLSGAKMKITTDIQAIRSADFIYTDVWVSMGEEQKSRKRVKLLAPYRVTQDMMERSGKKSSIFLHCLPAVRGNEVSSDVIDGPQSRVWDQAENRKHTIKALMLMALGK